MLALHMVLIARIQAVSSILVAGALIVLPILVVVVAGTPTLVLVLDFAVGSPAIGNIDFPHTLGSPLVLQCWKDQPMLCCCPKYILFLDIHLAHWSFCVPPWYSSRLRAFLQRHTKG